MTPRRFTLRTSHLLMWSSPLLLLVLVFTMNSRPLHAARATGSTVSPTMTTGAATGTTSTPRTPRIAPRRPATRAAATAPGRSTIPRTVPPHAETTSGPPAHSAAVTATSVARSVIVATVLHSGQLTLGSPEAILPLHGPGRWSLVDDHAVSSSLVCATVSSPVSDVVTVSTSQTCQLAITIATGAPTTWTLRNIP